MRRERADILSVDRLYRAAVSVAVLAVAAVSGATAQGGHADCLEMVRAMYRALNVAPPETGVAIVEYGIVLRARAGGRARDRAESVRIAINAQRMHMRSTTMEVYQDERAACMVVPGARTIYVEDADQPGARQDRMRSVALFQDGLFGECSVGSCESGRDAGGGRRRNVRLNVNATGQRAYGIRSLAVTIDEVRRRIGLLELEYAAGSPYVSMRIDVRTIETAATASDLNAPALSMVLDARGQPIAPFRGFRVVDNRKRR